MQSRTLSRRALGAAGLAATLLASCGSGASANGDKPTLYFSAIPDSNKAELAEGFARFAEYLSEQLDIPVEYKPSSNYSASVEAFKNGDVQLAWFGGVTGVQARQAVDGARAIAQGTVDPEYVSYFIANASTGIQSSEGFPTAIEGKSFTFGSRSSTSGRVMPQFFIEENTGKSPEDYFERINFHDDGHDGTAKLVESGAFDVGALSYKTYDKMVANGDLDPDVCVKIWTTPTYPDYNWTAHPILDERYGAGTIEKIQAALIGLEDPALLDVLTRPGGIIAAKSEDFDAIAVTMSKIGM